MENKRKAQQQIIKQQRPDKKVKIEDGEQNQLGKMLEEENEEIPCEKEEMMDIVEPQEIDIQKLQKSKNKISLQQNIITQPEDLKQQGTQKMIQIKKQLAKEIDKSTQINYQNTQEEKRKKDLEYVKKQNPELITLQDLLGKDSKKYFSISRNSFLSTTVCPEIVELNLLKQKKKNKQQEQIYHQPQQQYNFSIFNNQANQKEPQIIKEDLTNLKLIGLQISGKTDPRMQFIQNN